MDAALNAAGDLLIKFNPQKPAGGMVFGVSGLLLLLLLLIHRSK